MDEVYFLWVIILAVQVKDINIVVWDNFKEIVIKLIFCFDGLEGVFIDSREGDVFFAFTVIYEGFKINVAFFAW